VLMIATALLLLVLIGVTIAALVITPNHPSNRCRCRQCPRPNFLR
jgi:hypothetical protein